MRILGAVVLTSALALAVAGMANGTVARDALVRPGVGIGELRLEMTLREALRALGQPVVFVRARVFPRGGLRYIEYGTRGGGWRIGVFGVHGHERLALIRTRLRRERTREGVGVGTLVATVPVRLRAHRPQCVKRYPSFNYVLHRELHVASCAVRNRIGLRSATTVFGGKVECVVLVIRYQGCMRPRYRVDTVSIESSELIPYDLSWWYPVTVEPERPGPASRLRRPPPRRAEAPAPAAGAPRARRGTR